MKMTTLVNKDKLVLNVHELADILGISRPRAYELARQKDFPAIRVSERRIIIPVDGLCRWLEDEALNGTVI